MDYGDIASLNNEPENENEPDPSQLLRKKSMKQVINNIKVFCRHILGSLNLQNKKGAISGDLDLPLRDPESKKRKLDETNEEDDFIGLADDDGDDGEDDFYKQAKQLSAQKKQKGTARLHKTTIESNFEKTSNLC